MERRSMVERRTQLVQAALAVATREGIEAATVRAIATEAGVSLGVVHYCFEDKNELLREVGEMITAQNADRVELDRTAQPDVRTAVGAALTGAWAAIRENRGAHLLGFELTTSGLRNPELRGVATAQLERNLLVAKAMLEETATVAGVRWAVPVPLLARFCVAAMDGVTLAWLVDADDDAAEFALRSFADYIATHAVPPGVTDRVATR
ncbi:TetR/AcrR family transcriptional regulator [Pengzhenrongella frigida]|uniref:TetR/AcrR family transcriptional regulator n=1 Tax=Pengzhenrongella frigida TaxID=1259133 RepID=A0A4Q5N585_9MICO|nr:TetR family transcriptional regulator [Cellulomonas sp. HLT2-17]RYV51231.1 TetR/AcrR family transcriptional regulator [Cellulomonas sp. HLT2-17]